MLKNVLGIGLLATAFFVGCSTYGVSSGADKKVSSATVVTYSTQASTQTTTPPSSNGSANVISKGESTVSSIEPSSNNVVLLDSEVFADSIDLVIGELERLRRDGHKQAYLLITSPGGSVAAGAKLISYMDATDIKVNTICEIICASMAAHIHQAGKTRYMVDRSILMFHPASGGAQGTIEQMLSQINMYKLMVDRLDASASSKSNLSYDTFKGLVAHELWMDAQTSLEYKFTDGLAYVFWGKTKDSAFSAKKALKKMNISTPKYVTDDIPSSVKSVWANILVR